MADFEFKRGDAVTASHRDATGQKVIFDGWFVEEEENGYRVNIGAVACLFSKESVLPRGLSLAGPQSSKIGMKPGA